MSLQEKGREGDLDTETYRKEDHMKMEGCSHEPRNAQGHQKPEEVRGEPPLKPLEEVWPCQHFGFRFLASRTMRK